MNIVEIDEFEIEIRSFIARVARHYGIPAIAVALTCDDVSIAACTGTLIAGESRAPINARFQIGCLTKMLVAYLAARLSLDGGIDLDAPIGAYLSEISSLQTGREITTRHLLSHSGGYRTPDFPYTGSVSAGDLVHAIGRAPLVFQPGSTFSYEHSGFILASEILHRVTGKPFDTLCEELVIERIAEMNPVWDHEGLGTLVRDHEFSSIDQKYVPVVGVSYPSVWEPAASSRSLSVRQLAAFGRLVCSNPQVRACMQGPVVKLPPRLFSEKTRHEPIAYGLGCATYSIGLCGHNGSGRGQTVGLRFDAEHNFTVAVGLNVRRPEVRDLVIGRLVACLTTGRKQSLESGAQPDPTTPKGFEGIYVGTSEERIEAVLRDNVLTCVFVGRSLSFRISVANRSWYIDSDVPNMTVRLFKDPSTDVPCIMVGMSAYKRIGSSLGYSE